MKFPRFLTFPFIAVTVGLNFTLECADVSVEMSQTAKVGQSLWSCEDFAYAKNAILAFEVVQGDPTIFSFAKTGSETKLVLANQLKPSEKTIHHFKVRAFTNQSNIEPETECFSILTVTVIPLSWNFIMAFIFMFIAALIWILNYWIFRGGWNAKYEL